jgi:hypothetical protein
LSISVLAYEASKKLLQGDGNTLGHKVPPLDDLEYKPSRLGVQAKQLEAQTTILEMPWAIKHNL